MFLFLDHIREEIFAQKDRLLLWAPVFLAIGIGLYFSLLSEPPFVAVAALWAIVAAGLLLLWPVRRSHGALLALYVVMGALLLIVSGFGAAQWRTISLKTPVISDKMGPVTIVGRITDIDRLEPGAGSRVIVAPEEIEHLKPAATPRLVRLKIHDDAALRVGMRVRLLAGLNPPSAPVVPGGFDFQRYAYFKQIGAFGFAYRAPEILPSEAGAGRYGFWAGVDEVRQSIMRRIDAHLAYPASAFAAALMTGERAAISADDWAAIRAAGLAHMLAISGLHVGIVAGILFFLFRLLMAAWPWLALHHPIKKYAAFAALLGAAGYTILAGAGVTTLRALIMTGIVLIAIMLDRQAISLRTVALAAFALLLFAPESLFSAGFQMSFAAVTALVFVYEQIKPWWSALYRGGGWVRRAMMYFAGVILTTLVAGSAVAPFSLYHFQQYPLYDLPANILAAPLMSFLIMPGVVLSFFALPLGLEGWALQPLQWGIDGLLYIARDVEALPNATWNPPAWPAAALLCFVAGGLWFILWQGRLRFMAVILILCGLFVITQYKQPDILISSSGKLIAVRLGEAQMHLSSRVRDRFSAENWARLWGVGEGNIHRFPVEGAVGAVEGPGGEAEEDGVPHLRCGEAGCRLNLKGHKIALSTQPQGQAADCAWGAIVIAQDPLLDTENCTAPLALDLFDLYREGAFALWLTEEEGSVRTESVATRRGQRPWVIHNRR